ncbi:MAG: hypothetical protein FWH37_02640 [Candidatus Bathyarchaeota archaeon]|nr:hypothetical protein [Candidatus Termiticorpusculum sp.]
MIHCKKCGSEEIVKSGIIGCKQRYLCKKCKYHFRIGDNRINQETKAEKALCTLWYIMDKESFRTIGKLLQIHHTTVYQWVHKFIESLPEPQDPKDITTVELDMIWNFVDLSKENYESLKQLIELHEKQLPVSVVNTIQQHLSNTIAKLDS